MDTTEIKQVFRMFQRDVYLEYARTFQEELNRQCNYVVIPIIMIAIFSWLPYIQLDIKLHPQPLVAILFRLGFSLTGLISLVLYFTPYFRDKGYLLVLFMIFYLEIATAAILGLGSANPAYMGGYAMLILILPIVPFNKKHLIFTLFSSLALFVVVGSTQGMQFKTWEQKYGLYNLVVASVVSLIAVLLLNNIRLSNFEKSNLIYSSSEKLRKSALEIAQMNEELKKADKLKGKLLEIAAHDLKSPLQVIIGYVDLLHERFKGDQEAQEKLDIIYKSSDSMVELLDKLLKALTIDSGKLVLHRSRIDIGRLAQSLIKQLVPNMERKGQRAFFSGEEDCLVNGDEMLLREVMENLLSNAIKFSPLGKSIWVGVERFDSRVVFHVRDEGPGMSPDDQEKLFIRFQKLSARPTGNESSTGLGLAIARDLVELHQGLIRVDSLEGEGCIFTIELPAID